MRREGGELTVEEAVGSVGGDQVSIVVHPIL